MIGLIPFRTHNKNEVGGSLVDFFNDDDFFSQLGLANDNNMFNVDVRETDKEYLVNAELPGVNKEDISLDYEDNNLIIKAKRQEVHDDSKDNYIRKERSYGEFSRAFYLDNVNKDHISAKFENGELKIVLPKEKNNKHSHSKIAIK